MTATDEALMQAVRGGDLAKLGLLFERHHLALFNFLNRATGQRTVAEDLVQDVFERILKYRSTYRDGARFETWLFRIAHNARADHFNHRDMAEPLAEAMENPDPTPGPDRQLELQDDSTRLQSALMKLREDRRELIVLTRYLGMKHEVIADLLGLDVGSVKVRVHRALKELRMIFLQMTQRPPCDVKTFPNG